jgi:hypothetical protein
MEHLQRDVQELEQELESLKQSQQEDRQEGVNDLLYVSK